MIPIPKELLHLPTDRRGFPVPYVVLIDSDGIPHFKVNDDTKVILCLEKKICHVCGKPLGSDMWVIGGQLSAFHPNGAFSDGPVHKICGTFALKVCPYMAYSQYKANGEVGKKLKESDIFLFDPTQDRKRLSFFCFVHISNYRIQNSGPLGIIRYVLPGKPYREVEYWLDGSQITQGEVNDILKLKKEHNYTIKHETRRRIF